LPYPNWIIQKIDLFFSPVQKGFGLPAGLGVWMVNDRMPCQGRPTPDQGHFKSLYHSLPTLLANQKKNQTPETPNWPSNLSFKQGLQDMLEEGFELISKRNEYKAAIFYQASIAFIPSPFVHGKAFQSKTVIVADCKRACRSVTQLLSQNKIISGRWLRRIQEEPSPFCQLPYPFQGTV